MTSVFETATKVLKNKNASKDADSRFTFDKGARPLTKMGNRSVYLYEADGFFGSDLVHGSTFQKLRFCFR